MTRERDRFVSKLLMLDRTEILMNEGGADFTGPNQIEGRYANYFEVGHNAFEFVLVFGQFYPESHQERIHSRIITSPTYAKALLETLRESIDRYEQTFGIIAQHESE